MRDSHSRHSSERGGILGGLLISGLVVLCLVVAGAVFLVRGVHVSKTGPGGDDVSIDTPVGHLSVHAHENSGWAASDVPVYPGAHSTGDGGGNAVVEWSSGNGKGDHGFSVSATELVTPDPVDKVLAWYRQELPDWTIAQGAGAKDSDATVRLEMRKNGQKQIIAIHRRGFGPDAGTHIGVATVGEPASN